MEREPTPSMADNVYLRIGVQPFINCCGVRTIHGGSVMRPEVRRQMEAAAPHFVNLDELMEGVGRRLAELTGAPWAIVTSGASAALCHATAACIAGADPEKMLRLPDTRGLPHRVLMTKSGRFTYDHAIRMAGAEIVEVASWDQLAASLDDRVVMIALLGTKADTGEFRIPRLAELARSRGLPIVVDAASEHLTRPEPYLAQGATMVAYSGGKYLRGPQCTGLLLGEEAWVRAAWINSAPHHAFGRTMKVGKEEIIGLLAAVEHWATSRDPSGERRQWAHDLDEIAHAVTQVPSVVTTIREPTGPAEPVPRLEISWDPARVAWTGLELRARLSAGEPRIMLDDRSATATSVTILPNSLQPGQAKMVGLCLRGALAAAPEDRREPVSAVATPTVAGTWDVHLQYVHGTSCHEFVLDQRGVDLTGVHRTPFLSNGLSGHLVGPEIVVSSLHPFEGTNLAYRFTGTVRGASMGGTVEVGSSGESAPGPLNRREYGTARWQGTRRE